MVKVETESAEEDGNREMETIPEQISPAEEEEMSFRMSPLSHSYPDMKKISMSKQKAPEEDKETLKSWRC